MNKVMMLLALFLATTAQAVTVFPTATRFDTVVIKNSLNVNSTLGVLSHITGGGKLAVAGDTTLSGQTTLAKKVYAGSNLEVAGASTFSGAINAIGGVSGNLVVSGDTTLSGNVSLAKNLAVVGNISTSTLNVASTLAVAGTSAFTGAINTIGGVSGNLVVSGNTTLSGNVSLAKNLSVIANTSTATLNVNTSAKIASGGGTADASSILELQSTTKGFLPPRMTATQRDAISSPTNGLVVFNTDTQTLNQYASSAWAAIAGSSSGGGGIFAGGQNLITNNSFEVDSSGWTSIVGDTATHNTAAADILPPGVGSETYNASASGHTFTQDGVTITANNGLAKRNGVFSCAFRTTSTDYKAQVYDGSNVLSPNASTDVIPATDGTNWIRYSVNFVFPSSGTVQPRIYAQSNAGDLYIDDCFFGLADNFNVFQVSQANLVAKLTYAHTALCGWSRNSATIGDMTADTDCPAPSLDYDAGLATWSTSDVDLPQVSATNVPPGVYKITAIFPGSNRGGGATYTSFRLTDGTTNGAIQSVDQDGSAGGDTQPFTVSLVVTYTTAGSRTFKVQAASSAQTAFIELASGLGDLVFYIERWPSSAETVARPDLVPGTWSGYHSTDCDWTIASSTFADPSVDASCTFTERQNVNFGTVTSNTSGGASNMLPGIVFTPYRPGQFRVCASVVATHQTTGEYIILQLADGSNNELFSTQSNAAVGSYVQSIYMCANVNATTTAAQTVKIRARRNAAGTVEIGSGIARTIEWSITPLTQNSPAAYVTGQVSSNIAGYERSERANITCSSSSAINHQSGAWLTSVGNVASGKCVVTLAIPFASANYDCSLLRNGTSVTTFSQPSINNKATSSFDLYMANMSSGSATIAAGTAESWDLKCQGPKL